MAEYTYILTAGGPVTGSPLPPYFTFGDVAAFSLSFASGELGAGDTLTVAIDSNMEFYDPLSATGDASIMAVAHATIPDGYDGSPVAVSVPLNTDVFRQRVNGLEKPLRVHVGFYRLRGEAYSELGKLSGYAFPVVAGPNTVSPVLPVVDYPTREEAEALAERSENAAERAEEAAAGIVPPLQLSSPPTTSTVGSVGQLAVWRDAEASKDHLYHLCFVSEGESATLYHWEECVLVSMGNVAGGYPVLDEDGLVPSSLLPLATPSKRGVVVVTPAYGLKMNGTAISIASPSNNEIDTRSAFPIAITTSKLDYAVRSVLSNVTEIPSATSDYSLVDSSATTNDHSHVYSHSPSSTAPTYRLPQVTNTAIAHYIELTVDFTAVQTYSFLDYQGEPIVPLFTPAIAAGDVYTFKCEYSNIKAAWLIYPQKQGAVADDFVMRGEVGAANGVAGLDANGKLQPSQLPAIIATTKPTTSTVGVLGQLYLDTATSKTYHCTAIANTGTESEPVWSYTWTDDINANGGTFNKNIDITNNLARLRHGVGFGNIGAYSALIATNSCATAGQYSLVCGHQNRVHDSDAFACGRGSHIINGARITGGGGVNLEEVDWSGNLLINGGFQQNTHVIPTDTTEYVLQEGVSLHSPSSPSIYILPKIYSRYIIANNQICIHTGLGDGDGVFRWTFMSFSGQLSYYYTSSLYPAAGDYAYENTALTLRPHAISLPDDITHECILTIKFSSTVLTYEFQDSAGNTLVPLPLNGEIEAGSVVTFLCRYNPLLAQWVIYPVMDGKEAE